MLPATKTVKNILVREGRQVLIIFLTNGTTNIFLFSTRLKCKSDIYYSKKSLSLHVAVRYLKEYITNKKKNKKKKEEGSAQYYFNFFTMFAFHYNSFCYSFLGLFW